MSNQSPLNIVVSAEKQAHIVTGLLDWFRRHQRDLPWRGASPYAVWVSEIMLQQTQVATVIPYFTRFLERFPTLEDLANAPVEEVLKYWAGLGYYARARNLLRAAQIVVARYGGQLPDTPEEIETLPGIGRYTAGAILSIAFGKPRPIVDANVIRVLSRVFELRGDPKSTANQTILWSLAEQLVPDEAPGDFNQALMELGALVCDSSDPRCEQCPLLKVCSAGNSPDPSALPEIASGKTAINVVHGSVIIQNEVGEVLIIQRPMHGLWGGLWEFPRVAAVPGETPEETAKRAAIEITGSLVELGDRVATVKHSVTHHRINLYAFLASFSPSSPAPTPRECAEIRFEQFDRLDQYAFSAPQTIVKDSLLAYMAKKGSSQWQPQLPFHASDEE